MAKYRISVSLDGKNFFWIVIYKEKFIRNPTKEDLLGTKILYYNKTNVCNRCIENDERKGGKLTDKSILYPRNALRETNNDNWTGRWLCASCWHHIHYKKRWRNNIQSLDHRTDLKLVNVSEVKKNDRLYTDEQLLNELIQFEKENGRMPKMKDFTNNPKYPSCMPYGRFGSWNKSLEKAFNISREKFEKDQYTGEQLLNELRRFEKENGKPPSKKDFSNNHEYPSYATYQRFGGWNNALKLVGMDLDIRVLQGQLKTEAEKGRYAEIIIREIFDNRGKDISGKIHSSPFDGICPTGQIYEVKSSSLLEYKGWSFWKFGAENKDKDDDIDAIQWYYLVAFNKDFTKILFVWRIPGEIVDKDRILVSAYGNDGEFNVDNMTEYNITGNLKKMILLRSNNEMLEKLFEGE